MLIVGVQKASSGPSHPKPIGYPVDVVEPGGDQVDLQDGGIVKALQPQTFDIRASQIRRTAGKGIDVT